MTAAAKEDRARRERDLSRFASERIAHLATASPDGRPHIVPFCFVVIGSNLYSIIDDKPKKTHTGLRRLRNIEANPRVSVLADHYEEEWKALWFVMVEGEAGVVTDSTEYRQARVALRSKYPQYLMMELAEATNPMIRVKIDRVVSWQGSAVE
jgi:PPOX class probable F420-dependent enzyme